MNSLWLENDYYGENENLTSANGSLIINNNPNSLVIQVLNYVDLSIRTLGILVFLAYFLLTAIKNDLRNFKLLYVHHINFANFIYVLILVSYFNSTKPSLSSAYLNELVCQVNEIIWPIVDYLRSFSVLLLAFYRFLAVYYSSTLFKYINQTRLRILVPVLFIWLIATALAFITKFSMNTTYGQPFCRDGFSKDFNVRIEYMAVTSTLNLAVPFTVTLVLYFLIRKKLKGKSNNQSHPKEAKKKSKHSRFSDQLIAINLCYMTSFAMTFIASFRFIIPDFNTSLYFVRQLLRIVNVCASLLLPIISLYFNPNFVLCKRKTFESSHNNNSPS